MHSLTQDQHKELYALVSWVRSIPEFPLADGTRPSEYSDNADPPSVEVLMCALLEPDANW